MINGNILLVEDNEDDIKLTLRAFKKNNILNEVVIARDGQEALELLLTPTTPEGSPKALPSLVLLDLKLPKIDGIEVLRRIRDNERTTLLPVVALTSSKEEEDVTIAYKLRVNSFIRKPVDFSQFAEVVRELGLYWLVINVPPPGL